ncbi:MAG: glycosyltransferase family 2 protein [Brevinema sp.]
MDLKKHLDILVITYNRKSELTQMIDCIFADNSPIKDCDITFLDNHSTDGTSEMLAEYAQKYPNVRHIRHKYNIGGNANIVRAYETADQNKEYFWILCDDDYLDWTHWDKIATAFESKKYDLISLFADPIIPDGDTDEKKIAKFIIESAFIPASIIRTSCITADVLINAYANIHAMFPQLAVICDIVNRKGAWMQLPYEETVVHQVKHHWGNLDLSYSRGMSSSTKKHPSIKNFTWSGAFCSSLGMLQDETIRKECVSLLLSFEGHTYEGYLSWYIPQALAQHNYQNLIAIYTAGTQPQKDKFIQIMMFLSKQLEIFNHYKPSHYKVVAIGIKNSIKMVIKGTISLGFSIMNKFLKIIGINKTFY